MGVNAAGRAERLDIRGFTWVVDENFDRDRLFASLSAWSSGQILRRTPNRCVRVVHAETSSLVVKWFSHPGIVGTLKVLCVGTPAARQWQALLAAAQKGLPASRAVAFGERQGILRAESMLAVGFLENAMMLNDLLFGRYRVGGKVRRAVVREVAAVVRKAHDLGFYLPDLHAGNILIRVCEPSVEAYLIDLEGKPRARSLRLRERWRNLALFHGGCTEASRSERLRFLRCYLSLPAPLECELRRVIAVVGREGLRHRTRVWQKRQKRCVRNNREFVQVRSAPFFGFARRDCWNGDFAGLAQKPDRILTLPGTRVVKNSQTTTVGANNDGHPKFYVKRYNYQGVAYAAKDMMRSARARRGWVAANSLRARGVPVALPLAYLEKRRWGVLQESYLLTEAVVGDSVRVMLRRCDEGKLPLAAKRMLLHDLGNFLRKMHETGVAHRDLKGTNIIARRRPDGSYALHIVDFDGISLGPVRWPRRVKNLVRVAQECRRHLCLTRTDRLRFLQAYLGAHEAKRWRSLWLSVTRRLPESKTRVYPNVKTPAFGP